MDSGANVFAVKQRSLFYFYIEHDTRAQQVDGSYFQAKGWGGILIAIDQQVYLILPVFHCPNNPRNTFSPQALKSFSGFHKAVIDVGEKVVLVDHDRKKTYLTTTGDNDLDFLTLSIVMMHDQDADTTVKSSENQVNCLILDNVKTVIPTITMAEFDEESKITILADSNPSTNFISTMHHKHLNIIWLCIPITLQEKQLYRK